MSTFFQALAHVLIPKISTRGPVDEKIDNAIRDLKNAAQNNIATSKLLSDLLTGSGQR